jgi:hypothetical protein
MKCAASAKPPVRPPMPRVDRIAFAIAVAALPVRFALALLTDLSPDEAYYLSAARLHHPFIPDHPPLTLWLLQLADLTSGLLPVELAARWPWLLLGTAIPVALVDLVRRRAGGTSTQRWAAVLSAWLALPLAGGFLATPDTPCIAAFLALLIAECLPTDRVATPLAFAAVGFGMFAKVVMAPIAVVFLVFSKRSLLHKAGIAVALLLATLPASRSLMFQLRHAFAPATWTATGACIAVAAAVGGQLGLWTPVVPWLAARNRAAWPSADRVVVLVLASLFCLSALLRAVPPEPNWLAPAWLPVLAVAAPALASSRLAVRAIVVALGPALCLVFASHTASPWLPIPRSADPSSRLHGWRTSSPPLDAPGTGPYGSAAERCIYQGDCQKIAVYFSDVAR